MVCFVNVQSAGPHHLLHLPEIQSGMDKPHPPRFTQAAEGKTTKPGYRTALSAWRSPLHTEGTFYGPSVGSVAVRGDLYADNNFGNSPQI